MTLLARHTPLTCSINLNFGQVHIKHEQPRLFRLIST